MLNDLTNLKMYLLYYILPSNAAKQTGGQNQRDYKILTNAAYGFRKFFQRKTNIALQAFKVVIISTITPNPAK